MDNEKYNSALKGVQELYKVMRVKSSTDALNTVTALKEIFQELAESESEDERTRKAILTGLIDCKDAPDLGWTNFGGIKIEDAIAWLEKQGEQKPIAWSEEDDKKFEDCCGAVWAADYYTWDDKEKICDWLKSIKQRMGG